MNQSEIEEGRSYYEAGYPRIELRVLKIYAKNGEQLVDYRDTSFQREGLYETESLGEFSRRMQAEWIY